MATEYDLKRLNEEFTEYTPKDEDDGCCCCDEQTPRMWVEKGGYEYPNECDLYCEDCALKKLKLQREIMCAIIEDCTKHNCVILRGGI